MVKKYFNKFQYLLIIIFLNLISNYCYGQEINKTTKFSLAQLATHNFSTKDISKIVDWSNFYPKNRDGMKKLQLEIKENPNKFPLQELEDSSKSEPDSFRRWEYQMRRMDVTIISPNNNLLKVGFSVDENITFCDTNTFKIKVSVKNISEFDLPSLYFNLSELPGATINYKQLNLPKDVSFVRSANILIFTNGIKNNETKTITLFYNLSCDGKGGSPVLKGESKLSIGLNWELNFIGYILDYNNKKLYKVIDFGKNPDTIQFNKKTKS